MTRDKNTDDSTELTSVPQDYNNARVMDFHNVPEFANNDLSIIETARMPWHDASLRYLLLGVTFVFYNDGLSRFI
jgi:phospholipase D1/2